MTTRATAPVGAKGLKKRSSEVNIPVLAIGPYHSGGIGERGHVRRGRFARLSLYAGKRNQQDDDYGEGNRAIIKLSIIALHGFLRERWAHSMFLRNFHKDLAAH